jgi:hypothetical protein
MTAIGWHSEGEAREEGCTLSARVVRLKAWYYWYSKKKGARVITVTVCYISRGRGQNGKRARGQEARTRKADAGEGWAERRVRL